jgi:parallel beta-helix repeat protein
MEEIIMKKMIIISLLFVASIVFSKTMETIQIDGKMTANRKATYVLSVDFMLSVQTNERAIVVTKGASGSKFINPDGHVIEGYPNNWAGIYFESGVENIEIHNFNLMGFNRGFELSSGCQNILIDGCEASGSDGYHGLNGVRVGVGCEKITISNSTFNKNGSGIYVVRSSNVILENNMVSKNNSTGIELRKSNDVNLTRNTGINNGYYGIWLDDCGAIKENDNKVGGNVADYYGLEGLQNGQTSLYKNDRPFKFTLNQNYPNPFNPQTTISYQLLINQMVNLTVYNTLGQKVATVVDEYQQAGEHQVIFDAQDLPSGIYFYQIQTETENKMMKMNLLK